VGSLTSYVEFVKQQARFHESRAKRKDIASAPERQRLHLETAKKFNSLAADLELGQQALDTVAAQKQEGSSPRQLSLLPEDIKDLPEELLQQLSISEGDRTEFLIFSLVERAGGVLSLDKILIELWKKTGEIHKREKLTSRLYRMTNKGTLFNVSGKKGAYSTRELTEDEIAKLN
jgi:hypothetical protein